MNREGFTHLMFQIEDEKGGSDLEVRSDAKRPPLGRHPR
jgi:hypothetical protein